MSNRYGDGAFVGWTLLMLVLSVVVASFAALRAYRFALLVATIATLGWFLVTDVVSGGGGSWSAVVTLCVGFFYFVVAFGTSSSGLLVGGALLYWWRSTTADWWLLAAASVVFIAVGIGIARSSWTVIGALGLLAAAVHFSIDWASGGRCLPNSTAVTLSAVEKPLRIGVLAVQGNFREHAAMLRRLGADPVEVRLPDQLDGLDGLIVPGGESTTMTRLMGLYDLDDALREFDAPIFGTCAGMIVLDRDHLGLADIRVRRNAFGRQVHSFEADLDVGHGDEPVRAIFIRAPWIEEAGPDVEVLAEVDGHPVLARQGRILVAAFHPELTDDTRIHELFLNQVREATRVDVRA